MTSNETTDTPAEKLWCIHIPGPDDLYAAPDQQTAQKMADLHNAAMNKYLDAEPNRRSELEMLGESTLALVIEWPHDDDGSHADELLKFDPAEWGFGQPSPKVMHLPSEDTEGGSHD